MARTVTRDYTLEFGTAHVTCYCGPLQLTTVTYEWTHNGNNVKFSVYKSLPRYRVNTPEWDQYVLELVYELERTIQRYFTLDLF